MLKPTLACCSPSSPTTPKKERLWSLHFTNHCAPGAPPWDKILNNPNTNLASSLANVTMWSLVWNWSNCSELSWCQYSHIYTFWGSPVTDLFPTALYWRWNCTFSQGAAIDLWKVLLILWLVVKKWLQCALYICKVGFKEVV